MIVNAWGVLNKWGAGVIPVAPIGTTTIGTITVTQTTANVLFSYDNTDFTYFEYQLDSGTITTSTSPINLTGLIAGSTHSIKARAVNAVDSGEWSAISSFTTDTIVIAPEKPKGIVTIGTISVTKTTANIAFTYNKSDELSFQYRINGGEPLAANNPFDISGLVSGNSYTLQVRAINATGNGDWYSESFTTEAEAVITSTLVVVNSGVPDGNYTFDYYNDDTKTLIATINDIEFIGGGALIVSEVDVGTSVFIYSKGDNPPLTGMAYDGVTT